MTRTTVSRRKTVKLIAGAVLLIMVGVWFRGCFPPSQRSLIRNFQRHRDSFEKVRAMLDEDSVVIWGITSDGVQDSRVGDFCRPEDVGLSVRRYNEYRKLLKRAGARTVTRRSDEIRFFVAGSGFGSHGWRVAIVHRTTEPNDVIASLNEFRPDGSSSSANKAYCAIADGWYIWIVW
jgi:hypothetical protein